MNVTSALKFILALDFVKGAGTYVIGGLLIIAGVVCTALMLVDPAIGGTWIVVGYGLIRGRVPVAEVEKRLDEAGVPPTPKP